ncbi:MAG TPA: MFS transporter [Pyrinomonadaceae bacterium]|nr:MFS transporter [Pyrinomonadaceae bacterium]
MQKPRLSFWQIWNMSFGFFGIQFGWALQQANMSGIYSILGASPAQIPLYWLAAPMTGLLIQPIIGSMSDRTWNQLGRRRPYFLVGAILSTMALLGMPYSTHVLMAVLLLWVLDASINITMEPFRAFVADKLNDDQRTLGFVMQSFFIGIGAALASALPFLLRRVGVGETTEVAAGTIPPTIKYSFIIGAIAFFTAVIWTIVTSKEYPPDDMDEFRRRKAETRGVKAWFEEIIAAIKQMPLTMRQLAWVQVFTWFGLFCMWLFFSLTVARHVFGAVDPAAPDYDLRRTLGIEWTGVCFAVFNITCFALAFVLPRLAGAIGRKGTHALALVCGGIGLLSTFFIRDPYLLLIAMVGVGFAWASILSMPYVILSSSLPAARMGVYMGVFNFFIVLPQIFASLTLGPLVGRLLNNEPLYVVMLGGVSFIVAAILVVRVDDVYERKVPVEAVILGDEEEPLSTQVTAQPVPSTGLVDEGTESK